MNEAQALKKKRHRGLVLQLVHTNREEQMSRLDALEVWGLLMELNIEIGQNGVITLLQELQECGYLRFEEKKNRITGRTEISRIELTKTGCDLVERVNQDAAVLIP